jgi:hypothetical protein
MSGKYDDMLELPHHTSPRHPRMSAWDRAAQFAPFAALTGYEAIIAETARHTEDAVTLDENEIASIDRCLQTICIHRFFQTSLKKRVVFDLRFVGGDGIQIHYAQRILPFHCVRSFHRLCCGSVKR